MNESLRFPSNQHKKIINNIIKIPSYELISRRAKKRDSPWLRRLFSSFFSLIIKKLLNSFPQISSSLVIIFNFLYQSLLIRMRDNVCRRGCKRCYKSIAPIKNRFSSTKMSILNHLLHDVVNVYMNKRREMKRNKIFEWMYRSSSSYIFYDALSSPRRSSFDIRSR